MEMVVRVVMDGRLRGLDLVGDLEHLELEGTKVLSKTQIL